MKSDKPTRTISQVFEEFMADQKGQISRRTFSKYATIIGFYKDYMESSWPGHGGRSWRFVEVWNVLP